MRSLCAFLVVLLLTGSGLAQDVSAWVPRLGSPDASERSAARAALAGSDARVVAALGEGLASSNPLVAEACADLVNAGELKELRAVLVGQISRDGTADLVSRACFRALGAVGDYRDIELLCSSMARFPEAAESLVRIGEDPGRERLRAAAPGPDAHPAVYFAMASFGDEAGVEQLLAAFDGRWRREARHYLRLLAGVDAGAARSEWGVWWRREKLARALGEADWDKSEQALNETLEGGVAAERLDDLLALAQNPERPRRVRTKAILCLGLGGGSKLEKALLEILKTDEDGMVRVYAAEALGRVGSAHLAVDLCYYLIFDEEPFRKRSAKGLTEPYYTVDSEVCKALIALGVAGGVDFMIRQLSGNHRVRVLHQAVSTLRRTAGENFEYRPDSRAGDRRSAARRWRVWFDENRGGLGLEGRAATGSREFRRRVSELVDTLHHFHFLNMSRARATLVLLGETAAPELLAGLARPEMHVRVHCAEILGRIRLKAARGALGEACADGKAEVRAAAVSALGQIGPGPETDVVLRLLKDQALDVRIGAVLALSRVNRGVAVPAIEAALREAKNQSPTFQRDGHFSLAAHGDASAVDWLAERLESPDTAFRQLVADRLESLTGRNPGVEKSANSAWRQWWKVTRKSYRPAGAAGTSK